MYIKRVVLSNIKGFESLELDFSGDEFDPGWSVITGDNGAGKTALLRAIAIAALGPDQSRSLVPDLRGWTRHGSKDGTVSVEVLPHHDVDRTQRGGAPVQSTFWAEVEISADDGTWQMRPTDVFRQKKRGATNGPWSEATGGWFMLGYGPFRRMYGSSPDAQRLMVIPGRVPRFATLFKEDATLGEGEEWLKQLQYKKLESKSDEADILQAFIELAGDAFLREGVRIDRVDSDGLWLVDAAGRSVALADMSEGYRSALAMLIDIFRHMVGVYGLKNLLEDRDGKRCVARPGVVLIDEVDAHLHPSWQREIGFWLKGHFPEVQFIVTTHSPIVCQAADGGRVYHVPSPSRKLEAFRLASDDYLRVIHGQPDDILLSPAFELQHTRSPRTVRARQRHAALKAKRVSMGVLATEERAEYDQLEFELFSQADE